MHLYGKPSCCAASLPVANSAAIMPVTAIIAKRPLLNSWLRSSSLVSRGASGFCNSSTSKKLDKMMSPKIPAAPLGVAAAKIPEGTFSKPGILTKCCRSKLVEANIATLPCLSSIFRYFSKSSLSFENPSGSKKPSGGIAPTWAAGSNEEEEEEVDDSANGTEAAAAANGLLAAGAAGDWAAGGMALDPVDGAGVAGTAAAGTAGAAAAGAGVASGVAAATGVGGTSAAGEGLLGGTTDAGAAAAGLGLAGGTEVTGLGRTGFAGAGADATPSALRFAGCEKTPHLGAQVKYGVPMTLPSCMPVASVNSTPTHSPPPNFTGPIYRTTPCLPNQVTVCPNMKDPSAVLSREATVEESSSAAGEATATGVDTAAGAGAAGGAGAGTAGAATGAAAAGATAAPNLSCAC
mmetsp:Transcript_34190/g.86479  ORF Transcript_34190/g.86479 Transcript_34190/m.86479 type:complete len:406 (+) Transcript_34190:282-1499(+)